MFPFNPTPNTHKTIQVHGVRIPTSDEEKIQETVITVDEYEYTGPPRLHSDSGKFSQYPRLPIAVDLEADNRISIVTVDLDHRKFPEFTGRYILIGGYGTNYSLYTERSACGRPRLGGDILILREKFGSEDRDHRTRALKHIPRDFVERNVPEQMLEKLYEERIACNEKAKRSGGNASQQYEW